VLKIQVRGLCQDSFTSSTLVCPLKDVGCAWNEHQGGDASSLLPIPVCQADDIRWNESKKMSVKLIIFNQNTSMYKLKNNKNDEGAVVMRRQTWRADADDKGEHLMRGSTNLSWRRTVQTGLLFPKGWRRNEYKLVVKETYFKQASVHR